MKSLPYTTFEPACNPGAPRLRAPLRVHFDHAIDDAERRYGLGQLLEILGLPHTWSTSRCSDIYYGDDLLYGRAARVWICPEPESNWRTRSPTLSIVDRVPVLHYGSAPTHLTDTNRVEFDLPLCAAYWLTLTSERRIWQRDAHSRVRAADSLLGRHDLLEKPPLHAYAILLADMLWPADPPQGLIPRWPAGKEWAVAITHDVDQPERNSPGRSFLREILFPRKIARRQAYYSLRAELSARGFYHTFFSSPRHRQEWDFARFCALERSAGIRSAFYFSVVDRALGHPCDVNYRAGLARFRREFTRLMRQNFEVGLHAAYGTRWNCPPSLTQKDRLVSLAGHQILGVRHHYLHLDPDDPMQTIMAHGGVHLQPAAFSRRSQRGFHYDSSIGFNDRCGFRAGIALPFAPFHPAVGVSPDLIELPMTLADMHLPDDDREKAIHIVRSHLKAVRDLGGLAVLNWHIGSWESKPSWRAAFEAACELIGADSTVWCALPSQIASWWSERHNKIAAASTPLEQSPETFTEKTQWPNVPQSLVSSSLR